MGELTDMWREGDRPAAPDVRVVRHDESADDLEGAPDVIINHQRIDGDGNYVEPEGDQ